MQAHSLRVRDRRQKGALQEIEADFDNVRAAWDYWVNRQDAAHLLDFVEAAWMFFEVRGSFAPAIGFYRDAAQKLTGNDQGVICARAEIRACQAWFSALIGAPNHGLKMALESLDTLHRYNRDIRVHTLQGVTINAIFLNENQIVMPVTEEMMARADRSGDLWERAWALIWRAYAYVMQQQIIQAMAAGQEALSIFEDLGNPFGSSVASGIILGTVSMAVGDFATAKTHFTRGVEAAEEINYLRMLQISYDSLGALALIENHVRQAEQFFLKSLRISNECGQTREMLAALRDIANVRLAEGDLEPALQLVAVVLMNPANEQNSLNRPERLRDETEKLRVLIEGRLEPAQYRAAWEAGQRRGLAEVVAEILH
jgi:tetratricopeptide (TPR) repeat protein